MPTTDAFKSLLFIISRQNSKDDGSSRTQLKFSTAAFHSRTDIIIVAGVAADYSAQAKDLRSHTIIFLISLKITFDAFFKTRIHIFKAQIEKHSPTGFIY